MIFFARRVLLALCLWSVLCLGFGITGRILDPSGKPVAGASVSAGKSVVFSDAQGMFRITTDADTLHIARIGYLRKIISTKDLSSPVILSVDELILPAVRVTATEYRRDIPSLGARIIYPDTNSRVSTTADLLLENTSFTTTDIKLSGERATVSLLGSFDRHSLVLLDGVVLNPAGEAFDFSKIPVNRIDHIEVIKGNSSVYGGSAAIGGIIHIHTLGASPKLPLEASINADAGSFGSFKQAYSLRLGLKALSFSSEYTHQTAKNDFTYDTPDFWGGEPRLPRKHNRKTSDSFFFKSGYTNSAIRLDYSLNCGSFLRQLPGTINFLDLYDNSKLTGLYSQHALRGLLTHSELASETLLWWNDDRSTYANLGSTNPFATSHYRQKQLNRGVKTTLDYSHLDTRLGINAEYGAVNYYFDNLLTDSGITGTRETTAGGLRLGHSFFPAYAEYKVLGALRADYSEKSLHPTWRIENELILPALDKLSIGGYIGTAFSQPSLFDMYWIGDSETQGNPDLKSEESFGYNVYTEMILRSAKLRLAYFHNQVDDLIQWRQYYLNGVSWKPFNVGSADLQNLEIEAGYTMLKYLSLSANATFTKALDRSLSPDGTQSPTYNRKLVYTPDLKAGAKLAYSAPRYGLSLSYSYTGKQYSTVDNLIDPLPAFDLWDATGFFAIPISKVELRLDLKANNLLDKHYEIYAYTPQPGFNWSVGLSVRLNGASSAEEE